MPVLNTTALANSSGLSQVICVANTSVDGLLTGGLILALFFIMLLALKKFGFVNGLLVSSWSCFIVSAMMTSITCSDGSRWLMPYYALLFLLIAGLSAWYAFTQDD